MGLNLKISIFLNFNILVNNMNDLVFTHAVGWDYGVQTAWNSILWQTLLLHQLHIFVIVSKFIITRFKISEKIPSYDNNLIFEGQIFINFTPKSPPTAWTISDLDSVGVNQNFITKSHNLRILEPNYVLECRNDLRLLRRSKSAWSFILFNKKSVRNILCLWFSDFEIDAWFLALYI